MMYLLSEEQLAEVADAVRIELRDWGKHMTDGGKLIAQASAKRKANEVGMVIRHVTVTGTATELTCAYGLSDVVSPQGQPFDVPREIVEKWPKNRRRAYHVSHDAKNIFEDCPDAEKEKRYWHSIACATRLALLSLGAETKEMQGTKEVMEKFAAKLEASEKRISDLSADCCRSEDECYDLRQENKRLHSDLSGRALRIIRRAREHARLEWKDGIRPKDNDECMDGILVHEFFLGFTDSDSCGCHSDKPGGKSFKSVIFDDIIETHGTFIPYAKGDEIRLTNQWDKHGRVRQICLRVDTGAQNLPVWGIEEVEAVPPEEATNKTQCWCGNVRVHGNQVTVGPAVWTDGKFPAEYTPVGNIRCLKCDSVVEVHSGQHVCWHRWQ